jgi:hypothetical protein
LRPIFRKTGFSGGGSVDTPGHESLTPLSRIGIGIGNGGLVSRQIFQHHTFRVLTPFPLGERTPRWMADKLPPDAPCNAPPVYRTMANRVKGRNLGSFRRLICRLYHAFDRHSEDETAGDAEHRQVQFYGTSVLDYFARGGHRARSVWRRCTHVTWQ